jgi:hypothetical protein
VNEKEKNILQVNLQIIGSEVPTAVAMTGYKAMQSRGGQTKFRRNIKPLSLVSTSKKSVCCFFLVYCLAYSSILKMEDVCSSETSVDFDQNTLCYIPEDKTP